MEQCLEGESQNKLSHPHPKRNFVPTAVATKSGLVPVNAAKQSSQRATASISTARHVNTTALKQKVNNVTTAGTEVVVSTAEGKRENDVMSLTCLSTDNKDADEVPGKGDDDLSERNAELDNLIVNKGNQGLDSSTKMFILPGAKYYTAVKILLPGTQKGGYSLVTDPQLDRSNEDEMRNCRIESNERLFLAYASFMGFIVYQMDVKSAFLYGTIEEEVQDKYVADILKKFDFATVKTASTPIETNKELNKIWNECRRLVDVTRSKLQQILSHLHAVEEGGYHIFLAKGLMSWQCVMDPNQMLDYGFNFMKTKIYIDNESTICIVKNLVFHSKTKHIEILASFNQRSYEKEVDSKLPLSRVNTLGSGDDNMKLMELMEHCTKLYELILNLTSLHQMANLDFYDQHNMVAYLQKSEGSEGFHQIIDFLTTSHIRMEDMEITATIDEKVKVVLRHLLEDMEITATPELLFTNKKSNTKGLHVLDYFKDYELNPEIISYFKSGKKKHNLA
ncbi:putative ribonuclease H-like domain-containing protein [Tanacetum coccineum]